MAASNLYPAEIEAANAAMQLLVSSKDPRARGMYEQLQAYVNNGTPVVDPQALAVLNQARQNLSLPAITPGTGTDILDPVAADTGLTPPQDSPPTPGYVSPNNPTGQDFTTGQPLVPGANTVTGNSNATGGNAPRTDTIAPAAQDKTVPPLTSGTPGTSGLLGGYVGARNGDPNSLKGVLGSVMKGLGLNMDRPGLFSDIIQKEVGQYLPFYMSLAKPGEEPQAADAFQNMFAGGGGNPYENIASFARNKAQQYGNLGDAKDPLFQQEMVKGLVDMMGAPLDNVQRVLQQGRFDTVESQWREASLRNPQNYIDFIREHAKNLPEYQALLPLLGQGTAVAP